MQKAVERQKKRQRDGRINEMQSDALITSVVRPECKSWNRRALRTRCLEYNRGL